MRKLIILVSLLLFVSCAPTFSNLQSAKMVEEGKFELTPSYTKSLYDDYIGFQASYGLNKKYNLRLRFEKISSRLFGDCSSDLCNEIEIIMDNIYYYNIGIKFPLKLNRTAIYLPISFINSSPYALEPTFIFSTGTRIELTSSIKTYFFINESIRKNIRPPIAFNLGYGYSPNGFSTDDNKWILRSEIGIILSKSGDKYFAIPQGSIGLSIYP